MGRVRMEQSLTQAFSLNHCRPRPPLSMPPTAQRSLRGGAKRQVPGRRLLDCSMEVLMSQRCTPASSYEELPVTVSSRSTDDISVRSRLVGTKLCRKPL